MPSPEVEGRACLSDLFEEFRELGLLKTLICSVECVCKEGGPLLEEFSVCLGVEGEDGELAFVVSVCAGFLQDYFGLRCSGVPGRGLWVRFEVFVVGAKGCWAHFVAFDEGHVWALVSLMVIQAFHGVSPFFGVVGVVGCPGLQCLGVYVVNLRPLYHGWVGLSIVPGMEL